jgi:hypothetical protein
VLLLLALSVACFVFALVALGRRDDLFAALAVLCGGLALWALRRGVQLLEGA